MRDVNVSQLKERHQPKLHQNTLIMTTKHIHLSTIVIISHKEFDYKKDLEV